MLIMDYLVKQGFEAAAAFQEETLTEPVSLDYAQKSVTKWTRDDTGRDAVHKRCTKGTCSGSRAREKTRRDDGGAP